MVVGWIMVGILFKDRLDTARSLKSQSVEIGRPFWPKRHMSKVTPREHRTCAEKLKHRVWGGGGKR